MDAPRPRRDEGTATVDRAIALVLRDIAQRLESTEGAEARLRQALACVPVLVPAECCAVLAARPGQPTWLTTVPETPAAVDLLAEALTRALSQLTASGGATGEARAAELPPAAPWRSQLIAPLIAAGQVHGLLWIGHGDAEAYGEDEAALLDVVASQLAASLALLRGTERSAGEEAATEAARFLAAASAELASSLDVEATLGRLMRLAVPRVADWSAVNVVGPDGAPQLWALAAAEPETEARLRELSRRYPIGADDATGVARVLRTGRPEVYFEVSDETLVGDARDPEQAALLRGLGPTSYLCLPLLARGTTLGALTLATTASGRRYGPADLALAEELARRAAVAIDHAQLYRAAQRELAERERAEAALRASEERYRSLVAAMTSVVWTTDATGAFATPQPSWEKYTGQGWVEHAGWGWLAAVHAEDRATAEERRWAAAAAAAPFAVEERIWHAASGRYRFCEVRAVPLLGPDGAPREWVGTLTDVDDRHRAQERAARLQALTDALSRALTPAQVAEVVLTQGVATVGADGGTVSLLTDDGTTFEIIGAVGMPAELVTSWARYPVAGPFPLADAARTREPVWIESPDDWRLRYPETLADFQASGYEALASLPLIIDDRLLGGLGFDFRRAHRFGPEERGFMVALAQQCAQALERARLFAAERRARTAAEAAQRHLALLAGASEALAKSLDYEVTLQTVAGLAVPALADWCLVDVIGEDRRIRRLAATHVDPAKGPLLDELRRRFPPTWDSPHPATRLLRGGGPVLLSTVPETWLDETTIDADHRRLIAGLGLGSEMVVPLAARGRTLGAMTFGATTPGRFGPSELALAEGLARRAALAVDNARLFQAAEAAEARYHSLFEGAADAILVADAAGNHLDVNPAACALLGYSREELLRLNATDVMTPGRDWSAGEDAGFRAGGSWRGEVELRRKDGRVVPAEGVARVIPLPTGPARVAIVRDISERKLLETVRQEFLGNISHDLKNPLTAIQGQVQLLRRRAARPAGDHAERLAQLVEGLGAVEASAKRATQLIDELMDAALLQAGRSLELRRAPIDLVALAREAAEEHGRGAERHAIRVEAEAPVLLGRGDRARLARVLDNLLGNAIKYSPAGGEIVVSVRREADPRGREWAVLAVRDRGVGIPAADLPHVFERFRRGGNVENIAGTGIGLAGSRQVVAQHGGTIAVESREGEGSTFTVRLPLTKDEA